MNVYTYYEDIGFEKQDQLIDLWRSSWEQAGFNPVVLDLHHVKKNPYYSEFVHKLSEIHLTITGKDISDYCLSCFLRWMAYSTIDEDSMIVCDYDVINCGVSTHEFKKYNNERINLINGVCPALAIGTPQQFFELCHTFVNIPLSNIDIVHETANKLNLPLKSFHDNHFFALFRKQVEYSVDITQTDIMNGSYKRADKGLTHFSHRYVNEYRNDHPGEFSNCSIETIRINLIRDKLKTHNKYENE